MPKQPVHTKAPAETATNPPAGGTGATAGAYDTAAHRDALIASVTALVADVAAIRAALVTAGILGS